MVHSKATYTEVTWDSELQIIFDQVHGFTKFWFQSPSWSAEAFNELLNEKSASPETEQGKSPESKVQ